MLPKLYTVEQTAEYLQLDPRYIREMIDDGRLVACKLSKPGAGKKTFRIAETEIEACLRKLATGAPVAALPKAQKKTVAQKRNSDADARSFADVFPKRSED